MNIIIRSLTLFSGFFLLPTTYGAPTSGSSKCEDNEDWCSLFRCDDPVQKSTMEVQCKKTCGLCEEKLSACAVLSPCNNNGRCEDTPRGWFKCTCPPGFTGERCETSECKNDEPYLCDFWATHGQCCKSPEYMGTHCKQACGICENPNKLQECPCMDENASCAKMAAEGACCTNSSYMLRHCKRSCGQCGNKVKVPECRDLEKWCPSFPHYCDKEEWKQEMKKCGKTCSEKQKLIITDTPPSEKMYKDPTGVQMQWLDRDLMRLTYVDQ